MEIPRRGRGRRTLPTAHLFPSRAPRQEWQPGRRGWHRGRMVAVLRANGNQTGVMLATSLSGPVPRLFLGTTFTS